MITKEQEKFVREHVNDDIFCVDKLISYLQVHSEVGSEIFSISSRGEYYTSKDGFNYRLETIQDDFYAMDTNTFIRRIPFIFYVSDHTEDEHGSLASLFNDCHAYYLHADIDIALGKKSVNFEEIFRQLELMYYDYGIPIKDVIGYPIKQSGLYHRFDIYIKWWKYLSICKKLCIDDLCPSNILYAYNKLLEMDGDIPIVYEAGLTGFNENFTRSEDEITIEGEFPVDESGNIVLKWCGLWIENSSYVKNSYFRFDDRGLNQTVRIGLSPDTKIYMLNIFNDKNDVQQVWYPIYTGPRVMEFDNTALKYYRKERGKTQENVADAIGIATRTYQKWEAREAIPDGYNLIRIMNYLDISDVQFIVKAQSIYDTQDLSKFRSREKYC